MISIAMVAHITMSVMERKKFKSSKMTKFEL